MSIFFEQLSIFVLNSFHYFFVNGFSAFQFAFPAVRNAFLLRLNLGLMQILLPNQLLLSGLLVLLLQLKRLERGSEFAQLLSEPLILSHKRPFLVLLGRFQLTVSFSCILLRLL